MLLSDNIEYSFYICQQIKELTIMTNNSFSIRLREARQMMGLSMDKLVERTNGAITKQSISRYEKGIMRPKRDALQAIAKALNISEAYFDGTNIKIDVPMLRTTSMVSYPKTNCKPWKQNSRFGQSSILPRRKKRVFLPSSRIR